MTSHNGALADYVDARLARLPYDNAIFNNGAFPDNRVQDERMAPDLYAWHDHTVQHPAVLPDHHPIEQNGMANIAVYGHSIADLRIIHSGIQRHMAPGEISWFG